MDSLINSVEQLSNAVTNFGTRHPAAPRWIVAAGRHAAEKHTLQPIQNKSKSWHFQPKSRTKVNLTT